MEDRGLRTHHDYNNRRASTSGTLLIATAKFTTWQGMDQTAYNNITTNHNE